MAKADWCPRQSWYRLSGAQPSNPGKVHGHQLENIFDEGHTIHDKWQHRLWDMGDLWGTFECVYCQIRFEATAPTECPRCTQGREMLRYREVPIDGEAKYLIAGHEDGAVMRINALIEVKSIGQGTLRLEDPGLLKDHLLETVDGKKVYDLDGIWKNLRRPLPSHVRQTGIYLTIAKEMGLPFTKVVFIYEYKANQAVKEFVIEGTPRVVSDLLDSALDIKFALEKGREIPRPSDRDKHHKSCKECPFYTTCMGENDESSGSTETTGDASEQLGPVRPRRGSRRATEQAGDRPARAARGARTAASRGSDGPDRRSPDGVVRQDDQLVVVHGQHAGSGRGQRVVRRSRRQEA